MAPHTKCRAPTTSGDVTPTRSTTHSSVYWELKYHNETTLPNNDDDELSAAGDTAVVVDAGGSGVIRD